MLIIKLIATLILLIFIINGVWDYIEPKIIKRFRTSRRDAKRFKNRKFKEWNR